MEEKKKKNPNGASHLSCKNSLILDMVAELTGCIMSGKNSLKIDHSIIKVLTIRTEGERKNRLMAKI